MSFPTQCRCGYDHAQNDHSVATLAGPRPGFQVNGEGRAFPCALKACRNCRTVYAVTIDELETLPDIGVKEAELLADHQQREQYAADLQAEEDALKLKQSTCEHDY